MKNILIILLAVFAFNSAYASRCGLAVKFVNDGAVDLAIQASIDWPGIEIDPDIEKFPGDIAHPIKLDANSEVTELFAFPCGYPSDPSEFWVNYGISDAENIKRIKYEKGMVVVVGT